MRRGLLLLICVCMLLCSGCTSNNSGQTKDNEPIQVSDVFSVEFVTGDPYGLFAREDTRTRESYEDGLESFYGTCYNLPWALASTLSAFPTVVHECGFESANPMAVANAMDGASQEVLLDKLLEIFNDPSTEYRVSSWSGKANMLFLVPRDDEDLSKGLMLVWDSVIVTDHKMVAVAVTYEDGHTEYGYYDLDSGYQRFIPISDDKPAFPISDFSDWR